MTQNPPAYQRVVKDLNDSWRRLVNLVVNEGKSVSPRDIGSIEVENVEITYTQPTYVFKNRIRRLNPVFHLVELFYFMDGRNDDMLIDYIKKMSDFQNQTGRFDGSYGPAMYESLPYVIQKLKADKATRQAVFPMLRMQHVASTYSKDYPCNVIIGFRRRNDHLNMNVVTRSQDLYRGFLYDTLEFQLLQTMIAKVLDTQVGTYHHTIFSLHLYEDDLEKAQRAANLPNTDGPQIGPNLPQFFDFQELWEWSHVHCIIADLARFEGQVRKVGGGTDDIENAILRYKTRSTIYDHSGPYTTWVKEWLEK